MTHSIVKFASIFIEKITSHKKKLYSLIAMTPLVSLLIYLYGVSLGDAILAAIGSILMVSSFCWGLITLVEDCF